MELDGSNQDNTIVEVNLNDLDIGQTYQQILEERRNAKYSLFIKLEQSKYMDDILLPKYDKNNSTKAHLFSLLIFINSKVSYRINIFEFLKLATGKDSLMSELFENVINYDTSALSYLEREIYLQFLINCFQSLEEKSIAGKCLKLVSILIWVNLSKETLKNLFSENEKLIEKWKMVIQLNKKEGILKSKPCTFINDLLEGVLSMIEEENCEGFTYYLKFLEFVIDLLSQYSTRKFLLPLIREKHFYERFLIFYKNKNKNSVSIITEEETDGNTDNINTDYKLLQRMLEILKFYIDFEINEETGETINSNILLSKHYDNLNTMQAAAYQLFPDKLSRIYLQNISLIDNTDNIREMLDFLNLEELFQFSKSLGLLKYTSEFYLNRRDLIYQLFISKFERKLSILDKINNMSLYPDEKMIWDKELIPDDYSRNSTRPLPIPKLNLQFLTHYDYLLRNFQLFRFESVFEIRQDLEDVIQRMHPEFDNRGSFLQFGGWARMGIPIKHFKILTVKNASIGKPYPNEVIAEIEISVKGVQVQIKSEWDKLKRYDVLFLTTFDSENIRNVRGCEVICIFDEENNEFSDFENLNKKKPVGGTRRIHIHLDPIQYSLDLNEKNINIEEMYSGFQLLIRRKPKENNFKPILETIRDLMNSATVIPSWMEKVFLGYGDPSQAHYTKLNNLKETKIDFHDTFIDNNHFFENFTNNLHLPKEKSGLYSNKYQVTHTKNKVRFTDKQVEAIYSGVHKGLTLVVGPPGTGKTDVAVQIISLLYRNFPNQRTLIVTHSNFALNDIFEKISNLDIEEKYLLRLGIGEKDLKTNNKDFTKNGRINFMLQRRIDLLNEVLQLAQSMEVYNFTEYTCEHASNFYDYHIKPQILTFRNMIKKKSNSSNFTLDTLKQTFPFNSFFKYEFTQTLEQDLTKCEEMNKYLEKIFTEIEECRAFELLRNNVERGNYLLTKQSKIIAMTCTHAALKRREFIRLGFQYDNIIMEEAAQILEVETFIPMLLQENNEKEKESRLKRIVLIGDNNQLPPIIKSNAFKMYGKMDQSLYARFIRTGVPFVALDWQGRTRSSIVDLYRWRYETLKDLPNVVANQESSEISDLNLFNNANTGLTHEFQFINVPDFESKGETCPTPHFYQNLAEAEFTIATFMYMCLIGYDPRKITILTTYNGQKALLKDIYKQKCSWNPIFNSPATITTVDKYQGQQNDYVLLSLVRTHYGGHLKDLRRLIVSLSRARLGLYVFGRWSLFSNLSEMKETFTMFAKKPQQLELTFGEEFPTKRRIGGESNETKPIKVEDFRHMYRIVQEMIKIKYSG